MASETSLAALHPYSRNMRAIVLAAGKGTRMQSDLPKVLTPFGGQTLLRHALANLAEAEIDPNPIVVVGHQAELVKEHASDLGVEFVHQTEQLGTGHAVHVCKEMVSATDPVMVLYGDHALIKPETLTRLAARFQASNAKIAMITYRVPHFDVFNRLFERYGRILRDEDENMYAIREAKDATEDELQTHEVNPAYFLFDGPWLWENIQKITPVNAQSEYYLTDLVALAIEQGELVETILGEDLTEAVGVNTPEQLELAEAILANRS